MRSQNRSCVKKTPSCEWLFFPSWGMFLVTAVSVSEDCCSNYSTCKSVIGPDIVGKYCSFPRCCAASSGD